MRQSREIWTASSMTEESANYDKTHLQKWRTRSNSVLKVRMKFYEWKLLNDPSPRTDSRHNVRKDWSRTVIIIELHD